MRVSILIIFIWYIIIENQKQTTKDACYADLIYKPGSSMETMDK